MADQSALGPDGQLLDATEIEWYNDPDDAQPIQPASSIQGKAVILDTLGDMVLIQCFVRSTLTSNSGDCRYTASCSYCRGET